MNNQFLSGHNPSQAMSGMDFCVVFCKEQIVHHPEAVDHFPVLFRTEIPAQEIVWQLYVGEWNESPCWVVQMHPETLIPEGMSPSDLRTLLPHLPTAIFPLLSHAKHLLWWHSQTIFCSRCGNSLEFSTKERAKVCPSCEATWYPAIAPAIIVAITRGDRILLAHNRNFAGARHSVIAGFVEPGETLEDAVRREVREEVGLPVHQIQYQSSQAWPFPNSLMLGFTAQSTEGEIQVDGVEIDVAAWFTADNLPEIPNHGSVARHLIDVWLDRQPKS